jgi:predicted metal-dependent hydrolase
VGAQPPYEPEYLEGLRLFNAGRFWEAHEALERVWLPLPKDSSERLFYQGLILLAVAFLHRERALADPGRYVAPALRCYRSSMKKLEPLPERYLGLDLASARAAAAGCFEPLAAGAGVASLPPPPTLDVEPGE